MADFVMMIGLPGSGKTYKAKEKYTRLLGEQAMRDIYMLHEADVSAKKGI